MPASRVLMSLARLSSDWEVKKLVGLSRAELTLLPVASRFWVVARRSEEDWRDSRFRRTDDERSIPDIECYLSGSQRYKLRLSLIDERDVDRRPLTKRE